MRTSFYQDHPLYPGTLASVLFTSKDALCVVGLSLCLRACSDGLLPQGSHGPKEIPFGRVWFNLVLSPHSCLAVPHLSTRLLDACLILSPCDSDFAVLRNACTVQLFLCVPVSYLIAGSGSYRASDLCWFVLCVLIILQVIISVLLDSIGFCSLSPPSPISRGVSFIVQSP